MAAAPVKTSTTALPELPVIDLSGVDVCYVDSREMVAFPPVEASKVGEILLKAPLWVERARIFEGRFVRQVETSSLAFRLIEVKEAEIERLKQDTFNRDVFIVIGAISLGVVTGWGVSEALR